MRPPTTLSVRSSFPTKILLRTSTILSTNTHLFRTRTINSRRRGESRTLRTALRRLRRSRRRYTLRNFDRGIGLNEDNSFDGCDIVTPHVSFTITVSRPRLFLTSDTRMLLAQATGAVNSAPFDGFAAGELRFNGINSNKVEYYYTENGQSYKNWYWRISYSFEASPNVPLVFNNVPVVKRGWDYVWQLVERKENTTTGQLDCAVRQLNVERVYPEFDFALLGLPLPE